MKAGSLRLRLLAGTLAWIVLAVAVAGWGLRTLFLEHITQQLQAQLLLQLNQLSAAVDWTPDKGVTVAPMARLPVQVRFGLAKATVPPVALAPPV